MNPQKFIQLQLNGTGLPGIYVQEHLGAYRCLDNMAASKPRAITAIGGWLKQRFLTTQMGISSLGHSSIAVAGIGGRCLLFDCELHLHTNNTAPPIRAGPTPGNVRRHLMEHAPPELPRLAYGIYCDILSLFSDVTLIFVPDFDSLQRVIDFLCHWIQCSLSKGFPTFSRILLVHEQRPSQGEVRSILAASFATNLRKKDSTKAYSTSGINSIIDACFQITDCTLNDDIGGLLSFQLRSSFLNRSSCGKGFIARHYKAFLQTALRAYIKDPSQPFDFIAASRLRYPVPTQLARSIIVHLGGPDVSEEHMKVVASALALDAYPPQMHRKFPSTSPLASPY